MAFFKKNVLQWKKLWWNWTGAKGWPYIISFHCHSLWTIKCVKAAHTTESLSFGPIDTQTVLSATHSCWEKARLSHCHFTFLPSKYEQLFGWKMKCYLCITFMYYLCILFVFCTMVANWHKLHKSNIGKIVAKVTVYGTVPMALRRHSKYVW